MGIPRRCDGRWITALADLGEPELGSFSLVEMTEVRPPLGLGIERDILFEGLVPISVWTEAAHRTGSIREARALASRCPSDPARGRVTHFRRCSSTHLRLCGFTCLNRAGFPGGCFV